MDRLLQYIKVKLAPKIADVGYVHDFLRRSRAKPIL